ncbi:MAG: rhodanese-like domain-containing protein [Candidatus Anstonellales archaeon]
MKERKIRFITKEQLLEIIENRENVKIVEVLSHEEYKRGHIPGAINIPLTQIEENAPALLRKDEKIVVYCASYECHASTNAAKKLLSMGYKKVFDYKGGKRDWMSAGLDIEQ